jgi:Short C-terminal domain
MKFILIPLSILMIICGLGSVVWGIVQNSDNFAASSKRMDEDFNRNVEAMRSGGPMSFDHSANESTTHRSPVAWIFGGIFMAGLGGVIAITSYGFNSVQKISQRFFRANPTAEIERLAKLRADGYITGEEYEAAKDRLLGDV